MNKYFYKDMLEIKQRLSQAIHLNIIIFYIVVIMYKRYIKKWAGRGLTLPAHFLQVGLFKF